MRTPLLSCLLLLLAGQAQAHRLDEYLQTIRVALSTNRIDLSADLTPGVAIAGELLATLDQDRDGVLSAAEQRDYVHQILRDIRVVVDNKRTVLQVGSSTFPSVADMKAGLGVIRLKAHAATQVTSVGRHTLTVTNAHLPGISVYLINALVPKDAAIQIRKQTRDELQRDYRLDFEVSPARKGN